MLLVHVSPFGHISFLLVVGLVAPPWKMDDKETNSKGLRILIATEYLPPYVSGISNRCKNLIKGYKDAGNKVTVFSLNGTDCDHVVYSLPNPVYNAQRMFILPPLFLLLQLLNPFVKVNYDIIHLFGPLCLPFIPLLPLFKLRGVKIYVSYHVYMEAYKKAYFGGREWLAEILEFLYVFFYFLPYVAFADVVGIPSETADYCVFRYCRNIHLMKSGLDPNIFKPQRCIRIQPNPHLLVFVGRLAIEKNIPFLISAMADCQLSMANLIIVGDGPERSRLEAYAASIVGMDMVYSRPCSAKLTADTIIQIAATKRIVFTGMVYNELDIAKYYAAGDVFVSASASETFGFTVAEALACGSPSVCVRKGAFAQVYKCIDNWMFNEGDSADYCRKIKLCIDGGSEARSAARKLAVNEFSVSAAISDMLKIYTDVVIAVRHI